MAVYRYVLAASEEDQAKAVLARLAAELPAGGAWSLDRLHEELGCPADGLAVLVYEPGTDAAPLTRLVQEISLRHLPAPALVVLDDDTTSLRPLEPYLCGRFHWPGQSRELLRFLADRASRCRHPWSDVPRPVQEVVRRRLLNFTPSLAPLASQLAVAATHDVTVLLTGATGTGKTYLARLLHDCSPRREAPFVVVPCGAQPANLIESAFFGHVKGAFTGADRNREGKFAAAGKGTLLLDEIDALPLEVQAALLRVIDTGEYEPVGSNQTFRCAARLIVASNWDLERAVEQGRFRPDLYYRLNVLSFHLPPLCERLADVVPLARGLAARFAQKFDRPLFTIHPEVLSALENCSWPGNIRQLENVIQQAVLMCEGPELRPEHLPGQFRAVAAVPTRPVEAIRSLSKARELSEREAIVRALRENGYSRTRTAAALGISRVTLFKKMKTYQITDPSGSNGIAH